MNDSSLVIVFLSLAKKEWHIRRNYNLYSAFVAGIAPINHLAIYEGYERACNIQVITLKRC